MAKTRERKTKKNVGSKINVISEKLFEKVRKRLSLTKEQLPDSIIKEIAILNNKQIAVFMLDNPEGLSLDIARQPHGVLAISKHLPKEVREDKWETYEHLDEIPVSEMQRRILKKRYDTNLNRRLQYQTLNEAEKQYHVNPWSFFYSYRPMWFNHRNCKTKKAIVYRFVPNNNIKHTLEKNIRAGKDYYILNFNDFYKFKLAPIL